MCSFIIRLFVLFGLLFPALSSATVASYAGAYSGTYSGMVSGTWVVTVSSTGVITGTSDNIYTVSGQVSLNGSLSMTAGSVSDGSTFTGTINLATGVFSGTWINNLYGIGGTFTGVRATTTLNTLSVTRSGSSTGTIASNTGGIICGTSCWADYASGTSVTLTATPASGSYFSGWSGDCGGVGSCVVTMSAAKNVTATFKLVPFVADTISTITATSATITTTITFNAADVGKHGSVFITSWVPANGLSSFGILTDGLSKAMSVTTTSDNPYLAGEVSSRQETLGTLLAATTPNAWVLVQKTASGWQLVVNGQLIPYATGVLGDSLAAQSILNNTDPTNLPGAQFCVGYGTNDTEMITSGRMLPVAIIPASNSTATTSGNCNVAAGVQATEFYKADINHYFMTASSDEAVVLDNKPEWNWVRTGKTFNIWQTQSLAPSNASPVCRFYGLFSNGTVGSHFYTVDPGECEYVKGRLDWGWGYEGDAFYAVQPTGGSCPTGTSPVYRAYNNGMGGAPNHRYMTNQTDVDTMVSQGWVFEGTAFCGVQ